jgi:hypothetical protein
MSDVITVEILEDEDLVLELLQSVVYVGGGGGGGDGYLSYATAQTLTLTQLRRVRSNQLIGSAPVITYVDGLVSSITYADGSAKAFTYTAGLLTRVDYVIGGRTYRRDLSYVSGVLTNITETIL